MHLIGLPVALVNIPVCEFVNSFATPGIILPLAIIEVSPFIDIPTLPILQIFSIVTFVILTVRIHRFAVPILHAFQIAAFESVSILMLHDAFTRCHVFDPVPAVDIAVCVNEPALSVPLIVSPSTFVEIAECVLEDSITITLAFKEVAVVGLVCAVEVVYASAVFLSFFPFALELVPVEK